MTGIAKSNQPKPKPLTKKGFLRILEKVVTSPATPNPSQKRKPAPEASET